MKNSYAQYGFGLTELLITLVIVATLVAISVNSYSSFLIKSRHSDAQNLLMVNSQRLNRCFTLEGKYNGSCILRMESDAGYYSLSTDLDASKFTLVAVPVAGKSQANDPYCASFSVDDTGYRTATGTQLVNCWQ